MRWMSLPAVFCLGCLGFGSSPLFAAKFQMMKPGEWTIEIVESSMGPLAQAIKPKPFCIDSKMDQKNWEAKAKEDMKKAGLDCNLKMLKDEPAVITYQTDCKAVPSDSAKKNLLPPNSKFDGQVTVTRVSDTEYTMDQVSKGTGLNLPKVDLSKLPDEQRKLLEATLGAQGGGFQLTMKQKYTYASATCKSAVSPAVPVAPAAAPSTPATPPAL